MMFDGTPCGTNDTPFEVSVPEYSPPGKAVPFEYFRVNGLKMPMLETCGVNSTFPFGKSSPPLKFPGSTPGATTLAYERTKGL